MYSPKIKSAALDGFMKILGSEVQQRKQEKLVSLIHLGKHHTRISDLLCAVRPLAMAAPRSGHIGDWTAIAQGRAGALDFNYSVIAKGYGYASIHALTATETDRGGDRVYCPGSIIENGRRKPLPLRTWNGSAFTKREKTSLFSPFVLTSWRNEAIPLLELHKIRMAQHPQIRFRYEADTLLDHETELRDGLTALLSAAVQASSQSMIDNVIKGVACVDGSMPNDKVIFRDGAFRAGGHNLGNVHNVVDGLIRLLHVVRSPEIFFSQARDLPPALPIISNLALTLFSGIFTAASDSSGALMHLHWGARDMAGYPPHRMGYLRESGTRRRLTQMSAILQQRCAWAPPLTFVLLPASIFMLAPLSEDKADIFCLQELVENQTRSNDNSIAGTNMLVTQWYERNRGRLSAYFTSRFAIRSGLRALPTCDSRLGYPELPSAIANLPVSTACALTGALHAVIGGV